MILYAITIFLSAFLLFQVQPLIAKIILPWFGGSAAVWSAAMLFFQLCLLLGYGYAHLLTSKFKAKSQMKIHAGLLLLSCLLLPILPSPSWKPDAVGDPTLRILLLLAATIGLPYFLLSSTSPLLQVWYVRTTGSGVPYRLFALSNFGSMLALLSFPFLVEPNLASRTQAYTWSALYVGFTLLCITAAWMSREESPAFQHNSPEAVALGQAPAPTWSQRLLWISLAACASLLLVAITTHLSENVAPIPLLWIVPLALYLLSFILSFESDRIYQRWLFLPWLAPALAWMAYLIYKDSGLTTIKYTIPVFAAGLFFCCMMCHGELAKRRPAPQYLTSFYLMVSVGGAIGGLFVAMIAPRVFNVNADTQIGLVLCAVLAVVVMWNFSIPKLGSWPVRVLLLAGLGGLTGWMGRKEIADEKGYLLLVRNFYGALRVKDDTPGELYAERTLTHGTINHGSQILDASMRYTNTSYYGEASGVGRALRMLQSRGPIRYGVIGLGSGVLSNYGRKGDYSRIFEINPLVEQIAQREFSFFPHSEADKKILMGDARLVLEKLEPQNFDLLAVDAFSSDAIPVHLLTREAMELYARHLKPNGILALHISNRYLDLEPVCARGADFLNRKAWTVSDEGEGGDYLSSSTWVLVTADESLTHAQQFINATISPAKVSPKFRAWTDDYSNLWQIRKLE